MTTSLIHERHPRVDARPSFDFDDIYAKIAAGAVERERSRTLAHSEVARLWERRFGALRLPVERGGVTRLKKVPQVCSLKFPTRGRFLL